MNNFNGEHREVFHHMRDEPLLADQICIATNCASYLSLHY